MLVRDIIREPNQLRQQQGLLSQEMHRDSTHLADLRLALKAYVDNSTLLRFHRSRFVELLTRLRDQLAIHFTLKQVGGYLVEVVQKDPRLSEPAEKLRADHTQLFQMVCELVDQVEEAASGRAAQRRLPKLLKKLDEFECALQLHEEQEKELVLESVDRDLGGQG